MTFWKLFELPNSCVPYFSNTMQLESETSTKSLVHSSSHVLHSFQNDRLSVSLRDFCSSGSKNSPNFHHFKGKNMLHAHLKKKSNMLTRYSKRIYIPMRNTGLDMLNVGLNRSLG